jgi:predicted alpha/beta-hydrolase family hydrolase
MCAVVERLLLAHGASGTSATMQPHVKGLKRRGIDATAIDLPKGSAERAVPVFRRRLEQSGVASTAVGGHSYGGRVASMLCAEDGVATALVLLSYPLHRPGHPDELKVEHWPRIECPVLLLSGESDPFARVDLLRESVRSLRNAQLHTYPRVGHGLAPVLDDALDRVGAFLRSLSGGGAGTTRRRSARAALR